MSHFDGPQQYESLEEWEIQSLITSNEEKTIGIYIKTRKGEHRITINDKDARQWIDALISIVPVN